MILRKSRSTTYRYEEDGLLVAVFTDGAGTRWFELNKVMQLAARLALEERAGQASSGRQKVATPVPPPPSRRKTTTRVGRVRRPPRAERPTPVEPIPPPAPPPPAPKGEEKPREEKPLLPSAKGATAIRTKTVVDPNWFNEDLEPKNGKGGPGKDESQSKIPRTPRSGKRSSTSRTCWNTRSPPSNVLAMRTKPSGARPGSAARSRGGAIRQLVTSLGPAQLQQVVPLLLPIFESRAERPPLEGMRGARVRARRVREALERSGRAPRGALAGRGLRRGVRHARGRALEAPSAQQRLAPTGLRARVLRHPRPEPSNLGALLVVAESTPRARRAGGVRRLPGHPSRPEARSARLGRRAMPEAPSAANARPRSS